MIRPFVKDFLKACKQHWNIVAFTAGSREYAERVLDTIDPFSLYIDNIGSRENCFSWEGHHIKDLRSMVSANLQLDNMALLDNRLISFAFNFDQGIPILPFTGDSSDQELKDVLPFLEFLSRPSVSIKEVISSRYQYGSLLSMAAKKAK